MARLRFWGRAWFVISAPLLVVALVASPAATCHRPPTWPRSASGCGHRGFAAVPLDRSRW